VEQSLTSPFRPAVLPGRLLVAHCSLGPLDILSMLAAGGYLALGFVEVRWIIEEKTIKL